jgi:large subunit ribosomal protein L35
MKTKTHQAMLKRVKITGTGKIMRKLAAVSHLRVNKSDRSKLMVEIDRKDIKRIKRMLPHRSSSHRSAIGARSSASLTAKSEQ